MVEQTHTTKMKVHHGKSYFGEEIVKHIWNHQPGSAQWSDRRRAKWSWLSSRGHKTTNGSQRIPHWTLYAATRRLGVRRPSRCSWPTRRLAQRIETWRFNHRPPTKVTPLGEKNVGFRFTSEQEQPLVKTWKNKPWASLSIYDSRGQILGGGWIPSP